MPSRQLEVLRLYRDLLQYSKTLKYTDVDFYLTRIKQEFAKGKVLEDENEIMRQIAVKKTFNVFYQKICFFLYLERTRIFKK